MKVVIVNPSVFIQGITATRLMEQLFYLYSYLRLKNPEIEVEILDLALEIGQPSGPEEIGAFLAEAEVLLKRTGFDLVGVSCWTSHNYPSSIEIARICKRLNPEATLVVGGYHPTFMPEDFQFPGTPFDYVVCGEGEIAFWQIVTGQVPKEAHPQIVQGTNLPMDEPILYWGENKYHRNFETVSVWLSRGCPFSCSFCHDRLTTWRVYDPAKAVEELKTIHRTLPRIKTIFIADPLFGIKKPWRREFLQRLIDAKLDVNFWAETRVDILEEEDIELFSRLRFRVDFGLESVVPRILTIMKKTSNPMRYLECFDNIDRWMTERKMVHIYNHIYNYPGETTESLNESLKFWQRYFASFKDGECYTFVGPQSYMLYPGNDLWKNWKQYEEEYGCRALCPEWWKQPYHKLQDLSGDIIASRELAESHNIHLHKQVAIQVTAMGQIKIDQDAFNAFKIPPPPLAWTDSTLFADKREAYFDDKPLQLPARVIRHRKVYGTELLYDFYSDLYFNCSRATSELLRAVLDEGKTIDALALDRGDVYGDPLAQRTKIRKTFVDLIAKGLLELGIPAPPQGPLPAGEYRVRLRTNSGDMEVELYAAEAPGAVANLLHLIRWKYYDSLMFEPVSRPTSYIQVGDYTTMLGGPGYTLAFENSGRPARRGALVMDRHLGTAIHGGRFRVLRIDKPSWDDRELVFGRVIAGLDTLDRIVPGDRLLSIDLVTAPPPWGAEEAPAHAPETSTSVGPAS